MSFISSIGPNLGTLNQLLLPSHKSSNLSPKHIERIKEYLNSIKPSAPKESLGLIEKLFQKITLIEESQVSWLQRVKKWIPSDLKSEASIEKEKILEELESLWIPKRKANPNLFVPPSVLNRDTLQYLFFLVPYGELWKLRLLSKQVQMIVEKIILLRNQFIFPNITFEELLRIQGAIKNLAEGQSIRKTFLLGDAFAFSNKEKILNVRGTPYLVALAMEYVPFVSYQIPVLYIWDIVQEKLIKRMERVILCDTGENHLLIEEPSDAPGIYITKMRWDLGKLAKGEEFRFPLEEAPAAKESQRCLLTNDGFIIMIKDHELEVYDGDPARTPPLLKRPYNPKKGYISFYGLIFTWGEEQESSSKKEESQDSLSLLTLRRNFKKAAWTCSQMPFPKNRTIQIFEESLCPGAIFLMINHLYLNLLNVSKAKNTDVPLEKLLVGVPYDFSLNMHCIEKKSGAMFVRDFWDLSVRKLSLSDKQKDNLSSLKGEVFEKQFVCLSFKDKMRVYSIYSELMDFPENTGLEAIKKSFHDAEEPFSQFLKERAILLSKSSNFDAVNRFLHYKNTLLLGKDLESLKELLTGNEVLYLARGTRLFQGLEKEGGRQSTLITLLRLLRYGNALLSSVECQQLGDLLVYAKTGKEEEFLKNIESLSPDLYRLLVVKLENKFPEDTAEKEQFWKKMLSNDPQAIEKAIQHVQSKFEEFTASAYGELFF